MIFLRLGHLVLQSSPWLMSLILVHQHLHLFFSHSYSSSLNCTQRDMFITAECLDITFIIFNLASHPSLLFMIKGAFSLILCFPTQFTWWQVSETAHKSGKTDQDCMWWLSIAQFFPLLLAAKESETKSPRAHKPKQLSKSKITLHSLCFTYRLK